MKISSGGSVKNSWADGVCQSVSQSVSQCVCASTLVNSAGTAGPIGTGVPPIDAPIRRNDDGADPRSISGT